MKRIGLLIPSLMIAFAALPAWAQDAGAGGPGPMYGHGYMWHEQWAGHGSMFFGPFVGLLAIVGVVALIIWLIRAFGGGYHRHWHGHCPHCGYGRGRGALDVLEERFARGEIDKQEFEEKRKLLGR